VFIRPEEEGPRQPRKHWNQAVPIADVFGDKAFEGAVTRSTSRDADDEDDVLATGAPLIPVVCEPTVSSCVCVCVCVRCVHVWCRSVLLSYYRHRSLLSRMKML